MTIRFKIEAKKHHLGSDHKWSNDYYVTAGSITDAVDIANGPILTFEKIIHLPSIFLDEMLVSTIPTSDGEFVSVGINTLGENGLGMGDELPMWNVVLVKLQAATGRPALKYIRAPITEDNTADGLLDAGFVSAYNGYVSALFADMGDLAEGLLCKSTGVPLVSGATSNIVQMRQVHRKRRRAPAP